MAKRAKKPRKLKLSPLEREFVSDKIRLLRKEGKTQEQAVGAALGHVRHARKKGGKPKI